ncbi:uncharacterized protein fam83e [Betta splendens]|uniref:Uncharacterized protein fam83e n=1 Tax=Betta splendens TaxID=158456 RepID=A0A6P7MMH6_BETSP|nr:uncharacterized protein fam83e [Betta splendens]
MSDFQDPMRDILPLSASSPEFLHCEKERRALEQLLGAGPEAFYGAVASERCGCFLSPQEVRLVSDWAQESGEDRGEDGGEEPDDLQSTYFPCQTDGPAPSLDLGWPERSPLAGNNSVTVHSSPPAEGEPPVRQIIRWHLQKAALAIAIVTDSLSDGLVIEDLHAAASRGVRVYIILNPRSVQESFALDKLKHPNMRVRILGGKCFRSRTGKAVVGEMKQKFLLLDVDTVIHGSYSLTWTDAHLHRQLITVLRGPVVDWFDREFRILYAASLPASSVRWAAGAHVERADQLTDLSELMLKQQLCVEPQIPDPPSPPADSFMDWEAMGAFQVFHDDAEQLDEPLFDGNTPVSDGSAENGNQCDMKRDDRNASSLTNHALDSSTFRDLNHFDSDPEPSPTEPELSEPTERWLKKLDRAISRELSKDTSTDLDHRTTTRRVDEQTQTLDRLSSSIQEEEESNVEETTSRVETAASRKPLILRVPVSGSCSSCSEVMRNIRMSGLLDTAPKSNLAQMSQSMMDLSAPNTEVNHDKKEAPLSSSSTTLFNPAPVTPASVLMRNRSNVKKPSQQSTPKTYLPITRSRSFSFYVGMNHMKPPIKEEGDNKNT